MTVRFYLKRPLPGPKASEKLKASYKINSTIIFALINYSGFTIKLYTKESINPKFWNPATQTARVSAKFMEASEFNQRLINIRTTIHKVYLDYCNNNDHEIPRPERLKPLLESALNKNDNKISFLQYFDDFVTRSFAGQRIDPKSKKPIRKGVAKVYKSTLSSLIKFAGEWKRNLDFDTIDLEFHADFTRWLSEAPRLLSANTIGSNFQRIKAVLAEATEKGVNTNMVFKSKYFIKQSEEADTIYLNPEELDEMKRLDLKENPTLDNVRDLFLIAAYTGLRYSDFSILKRDNIKEGFIRITQTKTGNPVVIPVHQVVKQILEKYNGELPRSISNQKMNDYLKLIGKQMKSLQKKESKSITKGGSKITGSFYKWELLSSHAGRRSFATNEYNAGTPPLTISAITGHRSEASFRKYLRITSEDHAVKIKTLWEGRDEKAAKVVSLAV